MVLSEVLSDNRFVSNFASKKVIYPILMNLEFFPQKWMKSAVDRNFQPVVACDVHGRQDEEDFAQQSNGRAEGIGSQKVR